MKILVACEESQAVTIELRRLGHEAYSCDIEPCGGGHPEWHIQQDVLPLLNGDCEFLTQDFSELGCIFPNHKIKGQWDMIIAFPPCTDLCSSGARWFHQKIANGRQQKSIEFFMRFVNANCPRIAIENPIGIMSTVYRKPDQIDQPYNHGHGETKATCFWLKNLSPLKPTNIVSGRMPRIHHMAPGPDRAKLRSKTYPGIALAMAEQWAGPIERNQP